MAGQLADAQRRAAAAERQADGEAAERRRLQASNTQLALQLAAKERECRELEARAAQLEARLATARADQAAAQAALEAARSRTALLEKSYAAATSAAEVRRGGGGRGHAGRRHVMLAPAQAARLGCSISLAACRPGPEGTPAPDLNLAAPTHRSPPLQEATAQQRRRQPALEGALSKAEREASALAAQLQQAQRQAADAAAALRAAEGRTADAERARDAAVQVGWPAAPGREGGTGCAPGGHTWLRDASISCWHRQPAHHSSPPLPPPPPRRRRALCVRRPAACRARWARRRRRRGRSPPSWLPSRAWLPSWRRRSATPPTPAGAWSSCAPAAALSWRRRSTARRRRPPTRARRPRCARSRRRCRRRWAARRTRRARCRRSWRPRSGTRRRRTACWPAPRAAARRSTRPGGRRPRCAGGARVGAWVGTGAGCSWRDLLAAAAWDWAGLMGHPGQVPRLG